MSKLNIDQQTIGQLFSDKKSDFLIPDYQRPYAWGDEECQTLWDDIFTFAFPDDDYSKFDDDNDEYFLGPIVTFKNDKSKLEIIDGQQRLTTLMLMLRAFYSRFLSMQDQSSSRIRESLSKCIWKTDALGELKKDELKIYSEVSTDDDKEEFLTILKTGKVENNYKSRYAYVFRFFQDKINEFINAYPTYCAYLPARIMNNCILLPIEAESQDTALRIFSTLNDRGKPLSDADIFKAQFYKYYSDKGEKEEFIKRWKKLEETSNSIFNPPNGTPMDELFTRYMYFERAKKGIKSTTTEALRKFYEKDSYKLLKNDQTLGELEKLAKFWQDVDNQDVFSDRILRKLFVLNYAPNGMWAYLVSVYYLAYKDQEGNLDEDSFYRFLDKITAFIWAYAFVHPGVNALRTPVYPEMISIVNHNQDEFKDYKFDEDTIRKSMGNFYFGNQRPLTKSMLTWWAYLNDEQPLYKIDNALEIEHIYSRKRQENENSLNNKANLEAIGNKALLEKGTNIRASDYRFEDKKKYYLGFTNDKGKYKPGTDNVELVKMAKDKTDFLEKDIIERTQNIYDRFIQYLKESDLLN